MFFKKITVVALLLTVLFSVAIKAGEPAKATQTTAAAAGRVRPTITAAPSTTGRPKVEETTAAVTETTTVKSLDVSPDPSRPIIGRYFEPNRVYITQQEFELICCVVMREAGADYGHVEGCYAVAQCILEGMIQENESATTLLTHYWYKPQDAINRAVNTPPNQKTREAVARVFYEGYGVTPRPIVVYYSPANMENGWSSYHESQTLVFEIDGNRFFEKK